MIVIFALIVMVIMNVVVTGVVKEAVVNLYDCWPKWLAVLILIPPFAIITMFVMWVGLIGWLMFGELKEKTFKNYFKKP